MQTLMSTEVVETIAEHEVDHGGVVEAGEPAVHEHVWEWTRSGRVPGERGRFREHVCECGDRRRVDWP